VGAVVEGLAPNGQNGGVTYGAYVVAKVAKVTARSSRVPLSSCYAFFNAILRPFTVANAATGAE
jgi:hypothetical protein